MAHTRKSHGERKDKQNEKMHDAVAERKKEDDAHQASGSDNSEVRWFKPGGGDDESRRHG